MDAELVLDTLLAASSTTAVKPSHGAKQLNFVEDILSAFSEVGNSAIALDDQYNAVYNGIGATFDQLTKKIRSHFGRGPGPPYRALLATTGLLLHSRRRRGVLRGLATLGGIIVIYGVAAKVYNSYIKLEFDGSSFTEKFSVLSFDPETVTNAECLLYVRVIVAAINNSRCVSTVDLPWVLEGFRQCGLVPDTIEWLRREFSEPTDFRELPLPPAGLKNGIQIYTATRLAIDPDGEDAIQYIDSVAKILALSPSLRKEIDLCVNELKAD